MYNTTGIHRHSCISMFRDDIGHLTQALFSQVLYCQAFDWMFIVDHQDRYHWFELQWLHMVDSLYWKSVRASHQIYDFPDMVLNMGITSTRILETSELGRIIILSWCRGCLAPMISELPEHRCISCYWVIFWNMIGKLIYWHKLALLRCYSVNY